MKKIEDERIIEGKRRVNSNAFGISLIGLWTILTYRQFVLAQNVSEYMDIFLLTIALSVYVTANSVFKGFYLTYRSKEARKKVNLISAAVASMTFTIIQFFIIKYDFTIWQDIVKLMVSTVIFFVVWITCQSILLKISEEKANKDIE